MDSLSLTSGYQPSQVNKKYTADRAESYNLSTQPNYTIVPITATTSVGVTVPIMSSMMKKMKKEYIVEDRDDDG